MQQLPGMFVAANAIVFLLLTKYKLDGWHFANSLIFEEIDSIFIIAYEFYRNHMGENKTATKTI